ncbi:MAG: hypothetical protein A2Z88_11160 [Omnitrophica WOR_2 bacterium GWA2_47_8]|nr:MAG: hypothetical protein A2Z88_11160 [Omnitrophica WOR_2 bacterium GWA2_47_8]
MAIPFHKNISTLNAIHDTIITDRYAYRWFTYLVVQKALMAYVREQKPFDELYPYLKQLTHIQTVIVMLFLISAVLFFSFPYIAGAILGGLAILYVRILNKKRELVAQIASEIIKKDFDAAAIGQKTLFQIAEDYSTRLKIPSLVDTIYRLDQIYRNTVIVILLTVLLIYPMRLGWEALALSCVIYFGVANVINLGFLYRHLK